MKIIKRIGIVGTTFLIANIFGALGCAVNDFEEGETTQSLSSADGQWVFVHGASGNLVLNSDNTFTSTCVNHPGYHGCPPSSGTFSLSGSYILLDGDNGGAGALRMGGPVGAPDRLFTTHRFLAGVRAKRGSNFSCTKFFEGRFTLKRGPIADDQYRLHGSNQKLTEFWSYISEIAPNYYVRGARPGCSY